MSTKRRPATTGISVRRDETGGKRAKLVAQKKPAASASEVIVFEVNRPTRLPAPGDDWFSRLFGFAEAHYKKTQSCFKVLEVDSMTVLETAKGRFGAGRFECPQLAELRLRGAALRSRCAGSLRVQNELGDVAAKHALPCNRHATFQVASQFNCLEFPVPSVSPENGVTNYAKDRTQGPACSIACGAGTVYRNYFHKLGEQVGQTEDNMINNLSDVNVCLNNTKERLFRVQNGYTMATEDQLTRLNAKIRALTKAKKLDHLRGSLRVGVHSDLQVTSTDWGNNLLDDDNQVVTQVFCAACSVAYSRGTRASSWKEFATLVLEASYEATFWAALCNAVRHPDSPGSRRVFLTCLGGGVFGNSMDWIGEAMQRACDKFKDCALDVRIVTYAGEIHPVLQDLAWRFSS